MANLSSREIRIKVTSADQEYILNGIGRYTLNSISGLGIVDVTRLTQRLPMAFGHLDLGFSLPGRTILLRFIGQGCNNADYWDMREELISIFQPRNDDEITMLFTLPNNRQVEVDLQLTGDLGLDLSNRLDGRTHNIVVALESPTPYLRDPNEQTVTITSAAVDGWQIAPLFNSLTDGWRISDIGDTDDTGWHLDNAIHSTVISVGENKLSAAPIYPVIKVYGPCFEPVIINQTTDERLAFTASGGLDVPSGQYVEIDLSVLAKTVTDGNGRNLSGYLAIDSDLATWHLAPNGEMLYDGTRCDGNNTILFTGTDVYPNPAIPATPYIEVIYNNLYMGV